MFCSMSFMVSGRTLKFLIHFEFRFVFYVLILKTTVGAGESVSFHSVLGSILTEYDFIRLHCIIRLNSCRSAVQGKITA